MGINNGANKGVDVFYSGTVGAATEAALRGLPAVAFSRPRPELEPPCRRWARHAASFRGCRGLALLRRESPERQLSALPRRRDQGHPGRAHGRGRWAENYERREDPAGRPYWWIADFLKRDSGGDDTDIALMEGNWWAVTPLQVDRRTGNCSAACRSGSASSPDPEMSYNRPSICGGVAAGLP